MFPRLAEESRQLRDLLGQVHDHAATVAEGLADRPVAKPDQTVPGRDLTADGIGTDAALRDFADRWQPGFSGSAGPRYLGFVTGGATPASIAGDWLTSVFDQNPTTATDSSAVGFEAEALRWLADLFGLSPDHGASFVSGATMSNLVGLALGRQWAGEQLGVDVAEAGLAALGELPVLSGSPHSSIVKSMAILGMGRKALRTVPTLADREAVDVDALAAELEALSGRPAIVVANAGTVNTVDFDDLTAIADLRRRYPFWLHVDAAFGAFAALDDEHAHRVAGLDAADSICVDLHKWLNVPYDSAVQFTRRRDLQAQVFRNAAAYLGPLGDNPDPVHLTPENSRRLRALPVWFTLAAYGRAGHADIVRRDIALARRLGEHLDASPGYRLLAPVRLNVVCFTAAGDPQRVHELNAAITASGETFLTPTVYKGVPGLRAAFSNWRTTETDVERVAALLDSLAT
ncbi:pyridoxal phosphate-dependent decarboxylase family protein [Stackebrandtia nassauensis]|uniref:Pyridoxal-dependent decarboxylase n=1 Tax=Stackebrandtia nassauensis (strain DSM 44728 / CIP 108903 / NRRL B-16338 / NBRC 102104 / LLR-40K-21) TaxID=446470 RepID=D3Q4R6_STANL|nr:pyridoxal-dependent decarboxylase [Stackebrandtia nassauensis]ADD42096.1 Pyridoxal-dependent decarboxylase [Stackebrandtia nassauensis DSM 44728]